MRLVSVSAVLGALAFTGCAHTAAPKEVAAPSEVSPPAPEPEPKVTVQPVAQVDPAAEVEAALRAATVFFDFDQAQLKPEAMESLQRVARVLREHQSTVSIEGNCDERGTEEYNLVLGQRRAEIARKYLVDLGVRPSQLTTVSYGALRPANSAHTEAAWNENRRDELHAPR